MAWDDLKAILKADKESAREQATRPPDACPIDGTPLEVGKNGVRNCPMGNFRYP